MAHRGIVTKTKDARQAQVDARMAAIKSRLKGPAADYTINKGNKDWDAIFYWAAEAGDKKKLAKALKKGANINWANPANKSTPAHVAAWFKRAKILKWLRKKGADLSLKDDQGRTPEDIWELTKNQRDLTKANARYKAQKARKEAKAAQARELADRKAAMLGGHGAANVLAMGELRK